MFSRRNWKAAVLTQLLVLTARQNLRLFFSLVSTLQYMRQWRHSHGVDYYYFMYSIQRKKILQNGLSQFDGWKWHMMSCEARAGLYELHKNCTTAHGFYASIQLDFYLYICETLVMHHFGCEWERTHVRRGFKFFMLSSVFLFSNSSIHSLQITRQKKICSTIDKKLRHTLLRRSRKPLRIM